MSGFICPNGAQKLRSSAPQAERRSPQHESSQSMNGWCARPNEKLSYALDALNKQGHEWKLAALGEESKGATKSLDQTL
jgi:hypothetical protein